MSGDAIRGSWVDYILTTANSWKTPIKRFELIVERGPKREQASYPDDWDFASFCWDGPVKQVDPHRFEATVSDFVPRKELKILFLQLRSSDQAASVVPPSPQPQLPRQRRIAISLAIMVGLTICGAFLGWRVWSKE